MAIGDSNVGLLFRIRADSSSAAADLSKFRATAAAESEGAAAGMRSAFGKVEQTVSSLIRALGKIPPSAAALSAGLQGTTAAINEQLKKAQALGQTGAAVARSYEKLNEKITQSQNVLNAASAAFKRGEITAKQFQQVLASTEKTVGSVNSRLGDSGARLTDFASRQQNLNKLFSTIGNTVSSLGSSLTSLGTTLTVGLTAPLTALATIGVRSAITLDDLRNKLISATGSIAGANKEFAELKQISTDSAGVLIRFAAETSAFLKPMGLAEETIDNFTKALGRIKLTDSALDTKEFALNLSQLFKQNFELQDLKQLIGRFPRAAELIAEQFGIKSSDLGALQDTLQGMKAAGKLTFEQFIAGFADAANNDKALSLLSDTVGVRIEKTFERISFAIAPLGTAIFDAIEPFIPPLIALIESLSASFIALSPTVKTIIVAVGGIAAALGPVLIVIGSVVGGIAFLITNIAGAAAAVGGFVILAKITAVALLAIVPITVQLIAIISALGAAVYVLYQAWQRDFGGIQTFTLQAWEVIKTTVSAAMAFITDVVGTSVAAIVSFWRDNYSLIQVAVNTVSENIKAILNAFFSAVQSFWQAHGEGIKKIVLEVWTVLGDVTKAAVTQIGNFIRLGLQIINGDWSGAWATFLKTVQTTTQILATIWRGTIIIIADALKAIVPVIIEYGLIFVAKMGEWSLKAQLAVLNIFATLPFKLIELIPKIIPALLSAGRQIGAAVLQGVRDAFSASAQTAVNDLAAGIGSADITPGESTFVLKTDISSANGITEETEKQKKEAEKARKEREEFQNREIAAQIDLLKNQLSDSEKFYTQTLDRLRDKLKETGDFDAFRAAATESLTIYKTQIEEVIASLELLEKEQAKQEKKTPSEATKLLDDQTRRIAEINAKIKDSVDENNKRITEAAKDESNKRVKISEEEAERKIRIFQSAADRIITETQQQANRGDITNVQFAERASLIRLKALETEKAAIESIVITEENRASITERIALLDDKIAKTRIDNAQLWLDMLEKDAAAEQKIIDLLLQRIEREQELERLRNSGFTPISEVPTGKVSEIEPPPTDGFTAFFDVVLNGFRELVSAPEIQNFRGAMVGIGKLTVDMMSNMAGAVGGAIEQWALYGGSITKALQQAFAAELAHTAGVAAIYALKATALGFFRLAMWDLPGAANAFTSAGLWALLAGGTALAARAIAPNNNAQNSFNQQTNQATGGSGSSGSGSRNGGEVYSSNPDRQVFDVGRNQSQQSQKVEVSSTIEIVNKTGLSFDEFFDMRIRQNGKLRDSVRREANG